MIFRYVFLVPLSVNYKLFSSFVAGIATMEVMEYGNSYNIYIACEPTYDYSGFLARAIEPWYVHRYFFFC